MSDHERNGDVSFWYADLGGLPARRWPLDGNARADVCIVGAGYTGLGAAYYLKHADPGLNIIIVEKEFAGYGASGRNGGGLTGGCEWNHERYDAIGGAAGARDMVRAMEGTVDEVCRVAETEGIAADILRVDELTVTVNPAQEARLRVEIDHRRRWGEDRLEWIGADAALARVRITDLRGAMAMRGAARVQPAKLVRRLATAVERLGVRIAEGTEARRIAPGQVRTAHGTVRAGAVLRAIEGYTATLPGLRREWLPLNSAQIVTEPLPKSVWDRIGWEGHELLGDASNSYCYCQRTREGRITVGARAVPDRLGSGIDLDGRTDKVTYARLVDILHRHFPAAKDVGIAHVWCGVLGAPRDWCATVGFDPASGVGWGGGYVGVGVSTSNLAGRTLCDLVMGRETELTRLPWVNRRVRRWEPEPLRWLGVRGMHRILLLADRAEARGGGPSAWAKLGKRLAGR